jgi:pantoate--beta-alanine ligase
VLVVTALAIREGADVSGALVAARASLSSAGFSQVDYIALCDADTLQPLHSLGHPARLLVAARIGSTRLIDNIAVDAV